MKIPSPREGWRVFAGEVGVIVLGVLLALGAQQVVEDWQTRRDIRTFRETIDKEIGFNLWTYRYRSLQSACTDRRLAQAEKWLASADGRPGKLANTTRPNTFSLYRSAWDNRDAAVYAALPAAARQKYAEFYDELANNVVNSAREREAWQAMIPYQLEGPLTIDDRRKLYSLFVVARQLNHRIDGNFDVSFAIGRSLGIGPHEPDGVIAEDRAYLVRCPALVDEKA